MGIKVKKALLDQGITITRLARMTGFTRGHLSGVINGRYESIRAKKVIALALGVSYEDLWGPDERPKPKSQVS